MSGFDKLLSRSLENTIKTNLGTKTAKKVESRLMEKYNITLVEGIEEFQKVDAILREFFGSGADGLEKKFLDGLCKVKNSKLSKSFIMEDPTINQKLLEAYSDDDKAKILNTVIENSKVISEILTTAKIPQTSGYRKINSLIEEGILVKDGEIVGKDGRPINKYRALFDNVRINIIKNKITVDVQFDEKKINESTVLQVIFNL